MPRHPDHLIDYADVLLSTATSGEVRVNLGNSVTGEGYDNNASVWGPDGYLARPNDPSDDGAARALYFVDGNARKVFATCDNRFAAQAGALEPGDRMIVTDGAGRIFMKQATAHVGMYTEMPDEPPSGGKGMILSLNGAEGVITLRAGGAMIVLDGNAGTITLLASGPSGNTSITLDSSTISLLAGAVHLDGGFTTLGLNSDGTRPGKPGVDTVLIGALGQTGVPSKGAFAPAY